MIKRFLLVLTATACFVGYAWCQKPPNQFSIRISVAENNVERGSTASLDVRLSNDSDKQVTVQDDVATVCNFDVEIRNAKAVTLPKSRFMREHCPAGTPPNEGGRDSSKPHTVYLASGSSIMQPLGPRKFLSYQLPLGQLLADVEPGIYSVQVSRKVPASSKKSLESNVVTVTVSNDH